MSHCKRERSKNWWPRPDDGGSGGAERGKRRDRGQPDPQGAPSWRVTTATPASWLSPLHPVTPAGPHCGAGVPRAGRWVSPHDACYWLSPPSTLRTGRPDPLPGGAWAPLATCYPAPQEPRLQASGTRGSPPGHGTAAPLATPPLGSEQWPWDPGMGGRVGGSRGQRPWWKRGAWPGPNWADRGIWRRAGVGSSLLALLVRASLGSVPSGGARRGSVLKSEGQRDRDAWARGWGPALGAPATH